MSLQLQPQKNFTVVRQIANHLDEATYYVRAVIRNAYTDAIIATLDLDDKGNQRFKKDWQVPADPSGEGFYISIVTSVYSDSDYTTKSENYGDEETTYLVADRKQHFGGNGGIDAYTVRQIVKQELAGVPKPDPIDYDRLKQEKYTMRWDDVLAAITALSAVVAEIPKEKVDLAPVTDGIKGVLQAIEAKPVTPKTDLTPVLDRLSEDKEEQGINLDEIKDHIAASEETLLEQLPVLFKQELDKTNFVTSFVTHVANDGKMLPRHKRMVRGLSEEDEKEKPLDLTKLAL